MLDDLHRAARSNPLWFGSLGVIAVVQGFITWEFWGALSAAPAHQAGLRLVGLSFVVVEITALSMASRARLEGERARADTLRAMWAAAALLNLAFDVNAVAHVVGARDQQRAALATAAEAKALAQSRLEGLISAADDPFPGGLKSVAAYEAMLESKSKEIALAVKAPPWRQRQLERERGDTAARHAAALEIARWRQELDELSAEAITLEPSAAEFAPLAGVLTEASRAAASATGRPPPPPVDPVGVRGGLAIAVALAMKLMLMFGVWAGLGSAREGPKPEAHKGPDQKPQSPAATPERPDASERGRGPAPAPRARPRSRPTNARSTGLVGRFGLH